VKLHGSTYIVKGYFCSFECSLTYNRLHYFGEKEELLIDMYHKAGFSGLIKKAPNKNLMIEYGGKLTEEEYKDLFNKNIVTREITPPMKSLDVNVDIYLYDQNKSTDCNSKLLRNAKPFNTIS
jgi:hypothetical protein